MVMKGGKNNAVLMQAQRMKRVQDPGVDKARVCASWPPEQDSLVPDEHVPPRKGSSNNGHRILEPTHWAVGSSVPPHDKRSSMQIFSTVADYSPQQVLLPLFPVTVLPSFNRISAFTHCLEQNEVNSRAGCQSSG